VEGHYFIVIEALQQEEEMALRERKAGALFRLRSQGRIRPRTTWQPADPKGGSVRGGYYARCGSDRKGAKD
jgi:hypothetical protein